MPTYQYECENCGHAMEQWQSMTDKKLRKCPSCGKLKLQRLIGTGGGIIFKGTGFYETDFKTKSAPSQSAEAPAKASDTSAVNPSKSDSSSKDAKAAKSDA
ncbi:MAG: zinc ribbon domain-containing protein [Candidatus Omnitrophica bacterium]|nr:zinc ribbon domain-containing protein [Candidatus Omnitrophota bacterium]